MIKTYTEYYATDTESGVHVRVDEETVAVGYLHFQIIHEIPERWYTYEEAMAYLDMIKAALTELNDSYGDKH